MKMILAGALALTVGSFAVHAQDVISAKAGLINYSEGRVLVAGQQVEVTLTSHPEFKEKTELRTEDGRAEVLLAPGVVLRVGENSVLRMVTARLTDVRIEFVSGSIVIESSELLEDNSVNIAYGDATVHLRKNGLYRMDSQPAQLRVYEGEADVKTPDNVIIAKGGKRLPLTGAMAAVENFDTKLGDSLSRWSKRRAEYLAMANMSAAKKLYDSGQRYTSGRWVFNPYFGFYTFVPGMNTIMSPYGYRFYSPRYVYRVYDRPVMNAGSGSAGSYDRNLGYATASQTSSGYSGTVAASSGSYSAPSTTAAAAASAPVSRESGSAGGRGR